MDAALFFYHFWFSARFPRQSQALPELVTSRLVNRKYRIVKAQRLDLWHATHFYNVRIFFAHIHTHTQIYLYYIHTISYYIHYCSHSSADRSTLCYGLWFITYQNIATIQIFIYNRRVVRKCGGIAAHRRSRCIKCSYYLLEHTHHIHSYVSVCARVKSFGLPLGLCLGHYLSLCCHDKFTLNENLSAAFVCTYVPLWTLTVPRVRIECN